ncbi:MAG: AMP-binding protein, partial [Halobacteriovoraceae bacterium]|nr:AMP-binding protein [Halobacteriovoraceae bacterium]
MDIKELIRHRIFENSFGIYDSEGNITNVEKFRDEYKALRNYLSTHHRSSAPIGIKLPKNPYYLMTILACMESGVAYVPIRENYPQNRIDQIKDESGFEQLITMDFLSHIIEQNTPAACELKSNAQDTLYTICTSGSTGKPKAVVVPRGAITDFWKWCDNYFKDIDQSDRVLQVADFTFDISLIDVGLFLTKGASLYFSKFAGNIFILALEIEKNKITFLNTVVNNFNMLLEDSVYSRADLTSLKYVVMGGAR